jgi:hypothetical protein
VWVRQTHLLFALLDAHVLTAKLQRSQCRGAVPDKWISDKPSIGADQNN